MPELFDRPMLVERDPERIRIAIDPPRNTLLLVVCSFGVLFTTALFISTVLGVAKWGGMSGFPTGLWEHLQFGLIIGFLLVGCSVPLLWMITGHETIEATPLTLVHTVQICGLNFPWVVPSSRIRRIAVGKLIGKDWYFVTLYIKRRLFPLKVGNGIEKEQAMLIAKDLESILTESKIPSDGARPATNRIE